MRESGIATSLARGVKRRVKAVLAPVIFLSLVGYFGWNATKGDHGLVAYAQRKVLLAQVQADLVNAEAERAAWAGRVAGLRADHIEADTLDEQARAMLTLSNPNDVIMMYAPRDKLF
ncbi:MAG: septum formation initiator family protein [Pseudomonadota bacterium]|nr:septum formation initiator family protein [Pseudomonadota bacterium]